MILAHISDIHLLSLEGLRPSAFLSQRVLGGLNLLFNRARQFPPEVADALFQDLHRLGPDHLVVSGDVTNLSLPGEFELVSRKLADLPLPPSRVTMVPGNHDVYTYGSARRGGFEGTLSAYLRGDLVGNAGPFPHVRICDDVAIVALSSARPSPPFMAIGTLGSRQLASAEQLLGHPDVRGRFRVIVLHHAPRSPHIKWHARLTDAKSFVELVARTGADLILHGHLHRNIREELPGPDGQGVPVIGVNSGTWVSRDPARMASYKIYEVSADRGLSAIRERRFDVESGRFEAV
jgi:3',5'-cyclic AMP phosphodiesterase CpdA